MPTTRRFKGHARLLLGAIELEHLGTGSDHLLAGDCRLCRDGMVRADWEQGREAVMADWQRLGFPYLPLAAYIYDGEKLPPLDPGWRWLFRSTWWDIHAELAD